MLPEFLDGPCPIVKVQVLHWMARLPEKLLSLGASTTVEDSGTGIWPVPITIFRIMLLETQVSRVARTHQFQP